MRCFSVRSRRQLLSGVAIGMFFASLCISPTIALAQTAEPQPDPAGIATGDKSSAVDAGGTAFVVSEPTDKADPDYAAKKKGFDEFQALAAKEPLAVKLADSV